MSDPVDVEIARLEAALRADDPAFVRRCRHLPRRDGLRVLGVVVLLAASVVLLTLGFAYGSPVPWAAGAVVFTLAFVVDHALDVGREPA
jgi:hypothetical protein